MPFQLLVNTNQAAPSVSVQFVDANNRVVNTPAGAQVEFTVSDTNVLAIEADTNNALKGNITFPSTSPQQGSATVTAHVTGVNDINNQPYQDQKVTVIVHPGIPAQPASIQFFVDQITP